MSQNYAVKLFPQCKNTLNVFETSNIYLLMHMQPETCCIISISYSANILMIINLSFCLQCSSFVSHIITGYLPSLILQMFLCFVPHIMFMLSSIQGYIALSQIEKSACIKELWFIIWNIFFANVLSGSALDRLDVLLEPKKIPNLLAVAVPGQVCALLS